MILKSYFISVINDYYRTYVNLATTIVMQTYTHANEFDLRTQSLLWLRYKYPIQLLVSHPSSSFFFSIFFFQYFHPSDRHTQWRESRRPSQCSQGISIPEIRKFSFFFLFLSVWIMIGFFCVRCWNTSFMVGFRCLGNWLIYLFIFSI